jgi:hypothetical protein
LRVVAACLLGALVAVLGVAILVMVYHGFGLVGRGLPPDRVLAALPSAVADSGRLLAYAAVAGLAVGLLSLVPASVRSNAERLLLWGVLGGISGAFSVACLAFLYQGYRLHRAGVAMDSMPFAALVTKEMTILELLPYGAVLGAALAVVMIVIAIMRDGHTRNALEALASGPIRDPDSITRAERARRAQQYLSERRSRNPTRRPPRAPQPG